MAESGAHLADNVLPKPPYRKWVLSFPWPLRLLFAARPQWRIRVLGVVIRALSSALYKRGRASLRWGAHRDGDVHLTAMDGGNANGLWEQSLPMLRLRKLNLNVICLFWRLTAFTHSNAARHTFTGPRRHARANSKPYSRH